MSLLRVFSPRNLVSPQIGLKTLFAFTLKFLNEKLKLSGALWVSQAQSSFCPPFLVGKTLASMSLPEFPGWIPTVANQGRIRQEITWGKIKGTLKLIKFRRPEHPRRCTHPNLIRDPTFDSLLSKLSSSSLGLRHIIVFEAEAWCVYLCLPRQ